MKFPTLNSLESYIPVIAAWPQYIFVMWSPAVIPDRVIGQLFTPVP